MTFDEMLDIQRETLARIGRQEFLRRYPLCRLALLLERDAAEKRATTAALPNSRFGAQRDKAT